jgi:hypothetical protein
LAGALPNERLVSEQRSHLSLRHLSGIDQRDRNGKDWVDSRQQPTARRNDRYVPPAAQNLSEHFDRSQTSGRKRRMGTTEADSSCPQ